MIQSIVEISSIFKPNETLVRNSSFADYLQNEEKKTVKYPCSINRRWNYINFFCKFQVFEKTHSFLRLSTFKIHVLRILTTADFFIVLFFYDDIILQ